ATYMLQDALGVPFETILGLTESIQEKNRLWHDCWKTMNWAFAYSDRTEQPFGKAVGSHPGLADELKQYKTLIREADERIHAVVMGKPLPAETGKPAPPKSE